MATTAEIDAAIVLLRSVRLQLAQCADTRARCVLTRDAAAAALSDATTKVQTARDAVTAAKTALAALLATAET
jgi:hypothetical protein